MHDHGLVLAVDLGSDAVRLGLVDASGGIVAIARVRTQQTSPRAGWAEQDPLAWWQALQTLLPDLVQGRGAQVQAVALTGTADAVVVADAQARPLRPAIMPGDSRAAAEAAEPKPAGVPGRDDSMAASDGPSAASDGPTDACHPAARLRWLKQHEPGVVARATWILQPKDWLGLALTGVAASDPVGSWSWRRDEAPPARPEPMPIGSRLGPLSDEVVKLLGLPSGTPVVLTAMDGWCATLAIGAVRAGEAHVVSGRRELVGLVTDQRIVADGLESRPWGDGLWHLGGTTRSGRLALDWLADLLGEPVDDLLEAAASPMPREPAPLLFVPFLAGERVPFHAPHARSRFVQLGQEHGRADLARAIIEGIAFLDRMILERAEAAAGIRAPVLRATGAAARHDVWCRVRADVLGRPVRRSAAEEAALLGAGLVAWTTLGRFPDLTRAQVAVAGNERVFTPHPQLVARHNRVWPLWRREVERALQDAGSALPVLANGGHSAG